MLPVEKGDKKLARIKILDLDFEGLLERMLERICQTVNAEAGTLFIVDPAKKELIFKVVYGEKAPQLLNKRFSWDKGICGYVARKGQGVIVNEPEKDPRFNQEFDRLLGFKTHSLICLPLLSKDKPVGIIEIVNKRSGAFNRNDFELMVACSSQAAITLENYLYYQEMLLLSNYNQQVFQCLSGGFVSTDSEGIVTNFNPRASVILGLPLNTVLGKPYSEGFKKYPQIIELLKKAIELQQTHSRKEIEISNIYGKSLRIGYSTIVIQDKEGKSLGCAILFQDITRI
ncbi:MAG TPA: hypothetical protein DHV62_09445 [Elusimicrobia bacterium]|nr:hypothetical protein [Elusimicrobiota bacterium]